MRARLNKGITFLFDLAKDKVHILFPILILGIVLIVSSKGYGQFTNAERYFSPNLDGVKDFIEIPFTIKDENLQKWSLTIARKEGNRYKKVMFYQSLNPKEEKLSFTKFFSRLVAKDTPLKAPNSFLWEGRDDYGNLVEDGIYYFTISAVDRWGNENKSPLIPIVVDIVSPVSEFSLETDIFSPNGDGRKDELPIKVTSKDFFSGDSWTLTVTDSKGGVIKQFNSDIPDTSIAWDGVTDSGKDAPAGTYQIILESADLAGNKFTTEERKIYLVREFEKIRLEVSQDIFSPNQDGFFDNISFENYLSPLEGMERWALEIKDKSGNLVKKFSEGPLTKVIFYEGLSDEGDVLPDGIYFSQLRAWFRSGNQPNSSPVSFEIDTRAPDIGVKLRNRILNPNAIGSGFKNLLVTHSYDTSETNSYQINILKQNGDSILKKNYFNTHPPKEFLWDGKNEEGQVLPGKYVYMFKAKDEVENVSSVVSPFFEVITDSLHVEVLPDSVSISPNGDGQLDTITFSFNVNARYRDILVEGKLTINNERQEKVKEFSFTKFPNSLVWDGLVDPQFSPGQLSGGAYPALPDGVYFFTFTAGFQTKEEITLATEKLYLDTTPVKLELLPHPNIFSPNGDGNKDRIIFSNRYTVSDLKAEEDQFTVYIYKKEKNKKIIYRRKEWKGDFPSEILWTGEDQVGENSPEGIYQLRVDTVDHALNKKSYLSQQFELVREVETVDLDISTALLTAVPEGSPHEIIITPKISSQEGMRNIAYSLFLNNEAKTIFSRKNNADPVKWNLIKQKTATGIDLGTGLYYLQATVNYNSGNTPKSPVKEIYIDNDYPEVTVNTQPLFFSPDGDGINDKLSIRIIADDNYGVKKVQSAIFRKENLPNEMTPDESYDYHNKKQIPFKTWNWDFDSKRFDNHYRWDGRGDVGDLVESATDYILFVKVWDHVSLPVTIESPFLVDILVERLADGRLRIILNSINFKYNSDQMVGSYEKVLDLLIRMLNKFPDYGIHVVGHTDSRGTDNYNNALSVKRAIRVVNYLRSEGHITKERLTSEGKGKQELFIPNETEISSQFTGDIREKMVEDNYRKNRRVEFFLKRK